LGRSFAFNLRFPGQVFDGQAGLHQNGFRDFDPAVGKYVESDPIGLNGGINTYAYADSNTVSKADPDGKQAEITIPARAAIGIGFICAAILSCRDAAINAAHE
jgi:RHS repeat-associated protein